MPTHDARPGPFVRAYSAATGGVGILGRLGLKQERSLTDQLISQVVNDDDLTGLAPLARLGEARMTREQHAAFRQALTERAGTQKTAAAGFAVLKEQLNAITPRSDSDLEQLSVFNTRLNLAEEFARSANPQVQTSGLAELAAIGRELSGFSATNEAQSIAEEVAARAVGTERWGRFMALADDYRAETAPIRERHSSWQIMQVSATAPNRAGDVGRINAFMHIIEPGSIVMPGEAANVAGLNGVPDILVTAIARVMNDGGVLTSEDRRQLDMYARKVIVETNKELTAINQRFAAQARGGEIPDELAHTMFIEPASIEATGNERFETPPPDYVPTPEPPAPEEVGTALRRGAERVFTQDVPDFLRGLAGLDPKPRTYTGPNGDEVELIDEGDGRRTWRAKNRPSRATVRGVIQRNTDEFQ